MVIPLLANQDLTPTLEVYHVLKYACKLLDTYAKITNLGFSYQICLVKAR